MVATLLLTTALEAQAVNRPRTAADAVPTATCVSKVMKRMGDNPSDADQSNALKKCLTEEEVYWLGWFEQLDTSKAVTRCGLKETDALRGGDDGLLNSAAVWAPAKDDIDKLPFFRGQKEARDFYRASPAKACEDLIRDFGPKGHRFPGLIVAP